MKKIAIVLTVSVGILVFIVWHRTYPSMTGTVIDADTGKPIEGAVVLAEWTRTRGIGLTSTEVEKVVTATTDKNGRFTVSGMCNPCADAPDLTIYKKGYVGWNNRYIFPGFKKRTDFRWRKDIIVKIENFQPTYSHSDHSSFLDSCVRSWMKSERKQPFLKAFRWESGYHEGDPVKGYFPRLQL